MTDTPQLDIQVASEWQKNGEVYKVSKLNHYKGQQAGRVKVTDLETGEKIEFDVDHRDPEWFVTLTKNGHLALHIRASRLLEEFTHV